MNCDDTNTRTPNHQPRREGASNRRKERSDPESQGQPVQGKVTVRQRFLRDQNHRARNRMQLPGFPEPAPTCKHILGLRYYLEVQKDTPQGTVTEKVRLTYTQAWSAYNAAQTEEIKIFDALLKDLVKAIPEPEQKMGRPRLPMSETLFCAIQKVYSQLSSRRAHSLFQNAVERKQIDHAPYFNVTSAVFNNPKITPILHELVTLSALPVAELETDFAVYSTGFRTTGFSVYNGMKHGEKKQHKWIKAHMAMWCKDQHRNEY